MQLLKQSTGVDVRIGPAVDATDGVTPETTLALGTADQAEALKHNGAATVDISSNTFAAVTGCDGWYDLTLTTTDTNTLGQLTIVIQDSSLMLPIFKDFMVVPANVYDSLVGGTDVLNADVTQWLGTAAATPTTAGVPEVDLTHIAGSAVSTTSAQLGVNVVQVSGSADAANRLEEGAICVVIGTCGAGSTTTSIVSGLTTTTDQFNGKVITFSTDTTTAALQGQSTDITDTDALGNLTVTALSTAPASGDTYVIT